MTSKAKPQSSEPTLNPSELRDLLIDVLQEFKAKDLVAIDVRDKTAITDFMLIANGSSTRHMKTLAEQVHLTAKKAGIESGGVEGDANAEWLLVDLYDVIVHVFLPKTRDFYNLEGLWSGGERLTRIPES